MVKQQRRTRGSLAAAGTNVSWVRFPVDAVIQRRQQWAEPGPHSGADVGKKMGPGTGSYSGTAEEEKGGSPGADGGLVGTELKRARLDNFRPEEAAAPANGERLAGPCDKPGSDGCSSGEQASSERCEESRAAELQGVGSLKVTIQQSSESREFRQTDGSADREAGGLYCHVCNSSCSGLQAFQDHMAGAEHQKKLKEITHSVCLTTHTLQGRGRRPGVQRWCDTCQSHFSGDVILHRRTNEHKLCKQASRPFCPVCQRHFRTPRQFVEHMKSPEHKLQVHPEEVLEGELITVDAVGCFQEEEERPDEQGSTLSPSTAQPSLEVAEEEETARGEEEEGVEVAEEEEGREEPVEEEADRQEYTPRTSYGSSFVVPVSGFLCRLCHRFFHRQETAHTHTATHTHYLNLQNHRAQRRLTPPPTDAHTHTDTHILKHTHTDTHILKHTHTDSCVKEERGAEDGEEEEAH